jgi:hypothetical protein
MSWPCALRPRRWPPSATPGAFLRQTTLLEFRNLSGGSVLELVGTGANGYFVAAYASEAANGLYCGYYKIYGQRPHSYFDAMPCVAKGTGSILFALPEGAVLDAMELARLHSGNLPPLGKPR